MRCSEEDRPQTRRRSLPLLAAGAGAGLFLAAVSLLQSAPSRSPDLPPSAVARVNDTVIAQADFQKLVTGLENDTRAPADADMRRHLLDRMVEEELLVQHALELGLARFDRRVRADLTSALIASVVSDSEVGDPDDGELQRFFEQNRDLFIVPGRLRARQIFVAAGRAPQDASARERAEEARRRIAAGEPFATVHQAMGDREISPLPDALLPAAKLREYLGPTALRALLELEVREVSRVVRSGTGFHLLQLLDRQEPRTPSFEKIEETVRVEWRRRAGDRALRRYLDDLRKRAEILVREDLS